MSTNRIVQYPSPEETYGVDTTEEDYNIRRWRVYVSCMSTCSFVVENVKLQYISTWNPKMAAMFVELERALGMFIYNFGLPLYIDDNNSTTSGDTIWRRLKALNELCTMLQIVINSNATKVYGHRCWKRISVCYSRAMMRERDAIAGM